jgi:hypothetical protein
MEPKLRDVITAIQKLSAKMDKLERQQSEIIKQLSQVSKTVSPFQTTGPYQPMVTTAPIPPLTQETITKFLDGTLFHEKEPVDHHCPINPDGKHTLPIAATGSKPVLCTVCGKNTGGVVR